MSKLSRWCVPALGAVFVCSGTPVAEAATPPEPVVSDPTAVAPSTPPRFDRDQRITRGLIISGGVAGGLGLLMAGVGFGTLAGIHAGNPGHGASLTLHDGVNPNILTTAHVMQGVGMAGVILAVSGTALLSVGLVRRRRARSAPARSIRLAPGPRSVSLTARF